MTNRGPNHYVLSLGWAVLSGRPDFIATKGNDCVPKRHRFPDPPGDFDYSQMLERAEWAEADRDREYEAGNTGEARIRELGEEVRRVASL